MIDFLFKTLIGKVLITLFVSMVPIIELRGAIPIATGMGLSPWVAIPVAIIGNLLPVPFIILFIKKICYMKRGRTNHQLLDSEDGTFQCKYVMTSNFLCGVEAEIIILI